MVRDQRVRRREQNGLLDCGLASSFEFATITICATVDVFVVVRAP